MKEKFYLNENTGKLHKIGGCCHSKYIPAGGKVYKTEDEAIAAETRYMSYCKICFKENK